MSQAHVRDLSGGRAEQGIDSLLDGLPGLLSSAASQYVDLLRRSSRLVSGLLPTGMLEGANDCCTVPTQDCPPRCIAEICWEGCVCETQRAIVTVKNTGSQARNFSFAAGSLGPAKVEVSPAAAQLAPGQSVLLQVAVPPNQGLKEGETYASELLIRGAYEQCVKLKLRVAPSAVPQLDVAQGEVPERITELKWYRHWQCIDPCAPARIADPAADRLQATATMATGATDSPAATATPTADPLPAASTAPPSGAAAVTKAAARGAAPKKKG